MNPTAHISQAILLVATVAVCFLAAPNQAQADESVNVDVRVIRVATSGGAHVDPALGDLKQKLLKAFDGYENFKSLSRNQATIAKGRSHKFTLPDGTALTVTAKDTSGETLRLGLGVGDKFRTNVRVSPGNTFFQAGLPYKGGILVIAITAR